MTRTESSAPVSLQPRGLSVAAMICGSTGVLLSLVSLGLLPSVAGVVLGHLGSRRQPHARALSSTAMITGYVGIGLSVLWIVAFAVFFSTMGNGRFNFN